MERFPKFAAALLVAEWIAVNTRNEKRQGFFRAWTEQCQIVFDELKGKLTTAPILAYADFSLSFIL